MWWSWFRLAVAALTLRLRVEAATIIPEQSTPNKILSTSGPLFVDASGRHRIFRGTNVVYKAAPWHPDISPNADPQWSFNQQDIDILVSHGVTAIRLGVMWPGVEPVRGEYNTTYLDVMKTIVQRCQDAGIYVLLDFHQDGLSEKFCGEGVPLWAAQPALEGNWLVGFPYPLSWPDELNTDGTPKNICDSVFFSTLQFSFAAGSAYKRLYENYDGLLDSFVEYWKTVARAFLPFDNILGYDLMNEPFAGDVVNYPQLIIPGIADATVLSPFYDAVSEGIRSVDPNAMIFFEPVTWDAAVGFTKVPGGAGFANKSVLSFHFYQPPAPMDFNATLSQRVSDMARLGCGGMLTEFEMGWQNGANVARIREKLQQADRYLVSTTGWEYTDYVQKTGTNNGLRDPETGKVRADMAAVYSRTYATAVPGTPRSMSFNDTTAEFVLSFTHDGSSNYLEIRMNPSVYYSQGYNVVVAGRGGAALANVDAFRVLRPDELVAGASTGFLIIGPGPRSNAKVAQGTELTVSISAK
ncbi:Endoglycoceramidase [Zopfochytrium polystomum]|nr:Endoglycoceramidase [Zopfochytrium polystomum]